METPITLETKADLEEALLAFRRNILQINVRLRKVEWVIDKILPPAKDNDLDNLIEGTDATNNQGKENPQEHA